MQSSRPGTTRCTGGGQYRYYARLCKRNNVSIRQVCERIALRSSLSTADVVSAVEALLDSITDYLLDGNNVSLGDFGTYSLSISSDPVVSADKLTVRKIKDIRVQFRAGKEFKKAVQNAEFVKVKA
ncbi:MAG: HU family DNA-binding protein [Bacteroidales bacterium]